MASKFILIPCNRYQALLALEETSRSAGARVHSPEDNIGLDDRKTRSIDGSAVPSESAGVRVDETSVTDDVKKQSTSSTAEHCDPSSRPKPTIPGSESSESQSHSTSPLLRKRARESSVSSPVQEKRDRRSPGGASSEQSGDGEGEAGGSEAEEQGEKWIIH